MNAQYYFRNCLLLILSALLVWGCTTPSAPSQATSDKSSAESKPKVILLDTLVQESVAYNELHENVLPDGRLEVAANLVNRLPRRIQVETQCVFKDMEGMSTGDETPWNTLILTENAQETVRFASMNNRARSYMIRVRAAH